MHICPISFTGVKVVLSSDEMGKQTFWDEVKISELMRKKGGVNIPVIQARFSEKGKSFLTGEYETKGNPANINTNPIEEKHFKSLFNNLFLIDRAHGYHGNLGLNSLYFSDDGTVEVTNFRYLGAYKILEDNTFKPSSGYKPSFPDAFMPSSVENFEEIGLSRYLRKMKSDEEKHDFMKEYLNARGNLYNSKRLNLLLDSEFDLSSDAVRYEAAQKSVFKDPGYEVVDFNLKKMEMYAKRQDSRIAWADGNGRIDGVTKPVKRFDSIIYLLDCLKDCTQLIDKAEFLLETALGPDEAKYYEFEKQKIKHYAKEVLKDIEIRGRSNFNDVSFDARIFPGNSNKAEGKGLYLGSKEGLNAFDKLYSEIDLDASYSKTIESIDAVSRHYSSLIDIWNPNLNNIFKGDYVA